MVYPPEYCSTMQGGGISRQFSTRQNCGILRQMGKDRTELHPRSTPVSAVYSRALLRRFGATAQQRAQLLAGTGLDEKARTVEVSGVRHNYEECPLADVVRLLKAPEGTEPISRLHAPLGGMEQTARALRLLLEEQMRDDESKKK